MLSPGAPLCIRFVRLSEVVYWCWWEHIVIYQFLGPVHLPGDLMMQEQVQHVPFSVVLKSCEWEKDRGSCFSMYILGWIGCRIDGPGQFLILSGAIPGSCWAASCAQRAVGEEGCASCIGQSCAASSEHELNWSLTRRVWLGGGPTGAAVEAVAMWGVGWGASRMSWWYLRFLHACGLFGALWTTFGRARSCQHARQWNGTSLFSLISYSNEYKCVLNLQHMFLPDLTRIVPSILVWLEIPIK